MPETLLSDPALSHEMDLVICAPIGRDAQVMGRILKDREGLACVAVTSLRAVCERIANGAGAVLLTSEAISHASTDELNDALAQQPPWSDIPIIVLTRASVKETSSTGIDGLKKTANVMVVERPAQVLTILLAVRSALRARRRQYAVRGYLGAIRSSESQLRFALRAGRMGTWDLDLKTRKLAWSEGMFSILGLEPHAVTPTAELWREHLHPDDLDRSIDEFQQAMSDHSELVSEQRLILPGGRVKWVETRAKFSYDSDGMPVRAAGVAIDVDQRKWTEEQLRASQQVAEAASVAKDRFLAVLSHELRTPLTPVLALVQMLQDDDALPSEMREPMEMIRRNMELEARLIDDLLDLTRIVRGKFELQHQHVDLHEAIRSAMAICQHEINYKRIKIVTALSAQRHIIHGDSTRLQQVFWNLLKNAVKFTPEIGCITIETNDGANGGVVVTVTDTGVGIAKELLPHVFNAFEQGGREMTRAFGGLGLGLTISKAIVDAHGGTLSVTSRGLGHGASFSASFPPATVESLASGKPSARMAESSASVGRRILLVEDHPDTGNVLRQLLSDLGHDVRLTETVASAANALKQEAFDLIVSDLGLPDGSGIDLIRAARKIRPTPGIALSGYGMAADVKRSLDAGFDVHLTKPVDIAQLKSAVTRITRARCHSEQSRS